MRKPCLLLLVAAALAACGAPEDRGTTAAEEAVAMEVVTLDHAPAEDLARTLRGALAGISYLRIQSDPRSNSLILTGTPAEIARAREMALALDRPRPE